MIVKKKSVLAKPTKRCESVMDGRVLGDRLLEVLARSKEGIGLAANQIGVNFSVCVVSVNKPIIFVNPKITGKFGKSFYQEACLSFPGDYVITERWTNIIVQTDNHKKQLIFSFEKDALECVCVQHEIDHLNGLTMFDRQINTEIFDG